MNRRTCGAVLLVIACLLARPGARGAKTLDVYVIDVEGGQATLLVTPSGQSMLIDTGYPGFGDHEAPIKWQAPIKPLAVRPIRRPKRRSSRHFTDRARMPTPIQQAADTASMLPSNKLLTMPLPDLKVRPTTMSARSASSVCGRA